VGEGELGGPGHARRRPRVSRRQLLTSLGAGGTGLALGAGGYVLSREQGGNDGAAEGAAGQEARRARAVEFHGPHQAGIATPAQDRLHFAAFDVITSSRAELRELLRAWTDAAARMCAGEPALRDPGDALAPPADTGEAMGLPPARLTVTFGFGPSLFGRPGAGDRFGLAAMRPRELEELPRLPGDELDPARSGGDLAVQACADDPQVAFHAVRNLARIGRGVVVPRWSQLGFGRTSTTSRAQDTPRNLMGFKDGTNNLKIEDPELLAKQVWIGDPAAPAWLRGGTYMVVRRIRILIEVWDRTSLDDQELTIGRRKASGAPLGGGGEFDPVDLAATTSSGRRRIPEDAHIRLAGPAANGGVMLLRRGYSFTDGMDQLGQLDAGLFFICFQRDPGRQFVAIQRRLGAQDALNKYIKHTGSALFAVPAGVSPGRYVGQPLLG
jgi:deferrochelatase/peroxidase EfeB